MKYINLFLFICFSIHSQKLEDSILYKIRKSKEITVSVGANYEPFYIKEPLAGSPGFEVELANLFADYLGVKLKEVVPLQNFGDHAEAVSSGRVDVAFGNSSSMKRGKLLSFSDPYILTTVGGLVNKNILPPELEGQIVINKQFRNMNDIKNFSALVIGVKDKTSNLEFIKENFLRATIKPYPNETEALKALENNDINCYAADSLFIEGLLQLNPYLKARMQPLLGNVVEKQQSIAVKKDDILLLAEANFFIRELKRTGQINKLKEKYFNSNVWVPNLKK
jgi:polar amino acid transport system substrate-binding protein